MQKGPVYIFVVTLRALRASGVRFEMGADAPSGVVRRLRVSRGFELRHWIEPN